MDYILEIGRNEDLALAELKMVLGEESLKYVHGRYLYVVTDKTLDQNFLDKIGSVVSVFKRIKVAKEMLRADAIQQVLEERAMEKIYGKGHMYLDSNYLQFKDIRRCLTESKKSLLKKGVKVKFRDKWSTAALWSDNWAGGEIVALKAIKFRTEFFLLELVAVQNITAYTKRDTDKPYRDAVLGMLPPKLAQSMLNIGLGESFWTNDMKVMDPFCGTGTVLIEAALHGLEVCGSDIQNVNVKGSLENFQYVMKKDVDVRKMDARNLDAEFIADVDLFVTEGYLGKPKKGNEFIDDLESESREIERLIMDFMKNLVEKKSEQKFSVVLCAPVFLRGFKGTEKVFMKKIVEKCRELGYIDFTLLPKHILKGKKDTSSLLYSRSDQLVHRQIFRFDYIPG